MKVADIRRKLIATLAAGGLLAPAVATAANLNTNLIVNPGFENIDFGTTGAGGGPLILDWAGLGFTYSHDGNGGVPDYANGDPLVGGGSFYFYPGSSGGGGTRHHSLATAITQSIDVSTGDSATQIAAGTGKFTLSAFFSSYQTQTDHGVVQVDFLNSSNAVIGTGQVTPGPQSLVEWTQFTSAGSIPVGTTSVKVSAWGNLLQGGGADGYTDNLDFRVTTTLPALSITVNRSTGGVTLNNQTSGGQNISAYSITSAFEGLNPVSWLSITDNYDSGNPGPNQIDAAHAWAETSTAVGDVTESDPSTVGATIAVARTVNLGNSLWVVNPTEDLAFTYISNGAPVTGIVNYVGSPRVEGDLNVDGAITAADWVILRNNQLSNLSAQGLAAAYRLGDLNGDKKNDHADFAEFKALYDLAKGTGAFVAMVASVPEPSSFSLVAAAGCLIAARRRRSSV